MNDIDVTVYFNEYRLAALDEVLNNEGVPSRAFCENVLRNV